MTHLAINTDVLALSIIFITLLATYLYFKIRNMRKVIKALLLQTDSARDERIALEIKVAKLQWQNEILKEVQ